MLRLLCLALSIFISLDAAGITFEGRKGPGRGKHVVLVSGDEEYRSEEALPQLAKILSSQHGFRCTVLFAVDPKDGTVNPNQADNIPGLEALKTADLMIMFLRFRDLPDEQMRQIVEYVQSGRPIVALRTSTHAFAFKRHTKWADWSWTSKKWLGGFGQQILGETWVSHHGKHGFESTSGILAPTKKDHPILRGIKDGDVWGPTDVYTVKNLPADAEVLMYGQVLTGMEPSSAPLVGPKNDPMMPLAWTRLHQGRNRVFTTTMGSAQDMLSEGFRRLIVNASYWAAGLDKKISNKAQVELVGEFKPTPFKFSGFVPGRKPEDFLK